MIDCPKAALQGQPLLWRVLALLHSPYSTKGRGCKYQSAQSLTLPSLSWQSNHAARRSIIYRPVESGVTSIGAGGSSLQVSHSLGGLIFSTITLGFAQPVKIASNNVATISFRIVHVLSYLGLLRFKIILPSRAISIGLPFTRYGVVEGRVKQVWRDAIQDEKQGLVYKAEVTLGADRILVDRNWVPLATGMAVQAEIKTGDRRVISYFLSPLLRYRDESLRER